MTVAAYWTLSTNFGDALTPWLIEKIRGEKAAWVPPAFDAEHYVSVGSILNHANEHAFIWGAGIAGMGDGVNGCARIFAVRGPISRLRALSCGAKCPTVYGDPALLLPRFYDKPQAKKHKIGYVPHYTDQYRVFSKYQGEKVVNILDPIEKVIDDIRSCEKIVSSALHGIIVAHAYGIPAAWVKWGCGVGGDGTKYRDYFASVGMDIPNAIERTDHFDEIDHAAYTLPDEKRLNAMRDDLWGQCPIRRPGE